MPDPVLHRVLTVTATSEPQVYIIHLEMTDVDGFTGAEDYCSRPDDTFGLNPAIRQWLADHQGQYTIQPYVPPADPGPQMYRIAKSTPWIRMTDDEAELIASAMQQAPSRQKGIYDAATYLSSDDPLWSSLHDMIATTLNSSTRADELLAPET
jgi:hypothetical protein